VGRSSSSGAKRDQLDKGIHKGNVALAKNGADRSEDIAKRNRDANKLQNDTQQTGDSRAGLRKSPLRSRHQWIQLLVIVGHALRRKRMTPKRSTDLRPPDR
jgi:hypothetical protein